MDDLLNPYNEKNILITAEQLKGILTKYHVFYEIHDMKLWERAFVNSSYCKNPTQQYVNKPSKCLELRSCSNERLEFIGDGILELVTKYYLYKRFPDADEGFMTEKKIALVKNEHIGQLAYELGLHKWLLLSKNAEEKKNRVNFKKLGCLFEAFLGALFLDSNNVPTSNNNNFLMGNGILYCQLFIENVYNNLVNWEDIIENDTNYKNIFQVRIQKEFKCTPEYCVMQLDDDMRYTMGVYLCIGQPMDVNKAVPFTTIEDIKQMTNPIIFFGSGTHKIKKKAEQMACFEALQKLV
jgi:dsRNA-specific ribonuclease